MCQLRTSSTRLRGVYLPTKWLLDLFKRPNFPAARAKSGGALRAARYAGRATRAGVLRAARYRYRWSDPSYEKQTDGIRAGLRAAPALTLTILVSLSVASSPPPSLPPTPPEPTPAIKAALAEYVEYQLSSGTLHLPSASTPSSNCKRSATPTMRRTARSLLS